MTYMTLDIPRDGYTLHVDIAYTPGDPGQMSGPPENCYEPEPATVDVEAVVCDDGMVLSTLDPDTLTEADMTEIEEQAAEAYTSAMEAAIDDAREAREDARREEGR